MKLIKMVTAFFKARSDIKTSARLCNEAYALKKQGKFKEAHALYKQAKELDPNSKAARAGAVVTERASEGGQNNNQRPSP